MQSHPLWDTDMRPHGFGNGSRRLRSVSGLGRVGVRTKSGTNNTVLLPGWWKGGGKNITFKRRSLMCREGEVTKGKKRGCLERSETDNVSFGGNDIFKRENDTVDRGTGHKEGDAVGSVWPQWGNIQYIEGVWGWATSQWATPLSALEYPRYFKEG